ncbi:hypothetical protein BDN72DRAFT_495107 [Pluteus cervinus]|uniref:Uncharacterized protein n=1 Tax=Pluteus cervinus TaxID=181527 RepID=A0ACD3AZ75_9AGAR|nr:hypothetical protein BDN72DRAFT_495107 [Pluteus cervinus]
MQLAKRNMALAAPVTVLSLPDKAILRVLHKLDDIDLYRVLGVCRTLNGWAVHVLFKRYARSGYGDLYQKAYQKTLTLQNPPPSLLPVLCRALIVKEILVMTIVFSPDIKRFFEQARVLTELIERLPRNLSLAIDMSLVGGSWNPFHHPEHMDPDELAWIIQRLMETALKKGCKTLTISSNSSWFESLYNASDDQKIEKKGLPGLLKHIKNSFSGKNFRPVKAKNPTDAVAGSLMKGFTSARPDRYRSIRGDEFVINTGVVFEPFFLDWTLNVLNSHRLTDILITTKNFGPGVLRDVLPKLEMPGLRSFALDAHKRDLGLNDLAQFLQRHSRTLTHLTFGTPGGGYISPKPDSSPALHMYLPVLSYLRLSSYYFPWFLEMITSDPAKGLPLQLSNVIVIVSENVTGAPNLDQALESIVALSQLCPTSQPLDVFLSTRVVFEET